ncbi:MAG: hypothetical protein PUB67_01235 [Clostridiales bacterium]|nr:hypothetical protein [Clostridiales bacterium]
MFENKFNHIVKRQKSVKFPILLCFIYLFAVFLSGCSGDEPPNADTPEPAAHNGVFRSVVGSLTFNGDGESVIVCFEDEFAGDAGLPIGEHEGNYVFKFQQKAYRYDKAESFCIYIGDKEYSFQNIFQETNENVISVTSPVDAKKTLQFKK